MSNTARILLGLALGAASGLTLAWFDPALAKTAAIIVQPIGRLWLNALQMTVVPLVLALVIVGVSAANDAAASGRTARRAIVVFAALLSAGAAIAAIAAPALLSLLPRDPILIEHLRAAIPAGGPAAAPVGLADWFSAIIPANAIEPKPMPQRSNMPRRPMAMGEESGSGNDGFIILIHKNEFVCQQQRLSQLGPRVHSA